MSLVGDRKFYGRLTRVSKAIYSAEAARCYKESDVRYYYDETNGGENEIFLLVKTSAASFGYPITVLDLGCGTGRHFHSIESLKHLVGVDCSRPMLEEATAPIVGVNGLCSLTESSLFEIEFKPQSFDMVYAMGVFGCVCVLDSYIVGKVARWLKPNGLFVFTAVKSAPRAETWKSRTAGLIAPLLLGPPKRYVVAKLRDFFMGPERVKQLICPVFSDLTITDCISGSRVDLLCVARK
jgi:ubiquinone/menaquinone biosynthesis C-methylase UbiE